MNFIIQSAIQVLAGLLLGGDVFERLFAVVERWDDKALATLEKYRLAPSDTLGDLKRRGALAEIAILDGLQLSQRLARLGLELAVASLKELKAAA